MSSKILDLGCGTGKWPKRLTPPTASTQLIGIDLSYEACLGASQKQSKPRWECACARAEQLPLKECSIDVVISTVALPYMDIRAALNEIRRVLRPGGSLDVTLHPFSFVMQNLRQRPPLTPASLLYRIYVMANGLWFHFTGSTWAFPFSHRVESWQSEHGIRIALRRAGFTEIRCTRLPNKCFVVQAVYPVSLKEFSPEKVPILAPALAATAESIETRLLPAEVEGKR